MAYLCRLDKNKHRLYDGIQPFLKLMGMYTLASNGTFPPSLTRSAKKRNENFITFLFGGIRRSAFFEALAFLTAAVLLNLLLGDGQRFISVNPHPFWIILLLVIVQYGQREAVFTALLATAFLLVGNMPEQSLTETMYDYYFRLFLQPLLWIVMALLLGSIRARQLHEREDLFESLWKSEQAAHILSDSYLSLKKANERLELRLAEERRSVLTVYRMTKTMSETKRSFAEQVEGLMETALHPKKFSLFLYGDNALTLEKSFGWKANDPYARRFNEKSPLLRDLLKNNRVLCVCDEEQAGFLEREGIMAGPLYDEETGSLLGLLKIEEMDFIDFSANDLETFKIVCAWLAAARSRKENKKDKAKNATKNGKALRNGGKSILLAAPPLCAKKSPFEARDTA